MKEIKLTQGKVTLVDDDDYEWLSKNKWCVHKKTKGGFYAQRGVSRKAQGKKRVVMMHRVIMDAPKGMSVDHIDGDGLNNQRSNLRICTQSENSRNRGATSINKSGFKGVSWKKTNKKWQVTIGFNAKRKYLGLFTTKEEAYKAYCDACLELHGQFARLK